MIPTDDTYFDFIEFIFDCAYCKKENRLNLTRGFLGSVNYFDYQCKEKECEKIMRLKICNEALEKVIKFSSQPSHNVLIIFNKRRMMGYL